MGDLNEDSNGNKDKLIEHYDSILRESSLLTTVAGILFGFLLNISVNSPAEFGESNKVLLLLALFSITVATLLFSMPVIYHHFQYPYRKFEKFQLRSHRFILFGIFPFFITLYICLSLAILILIRSSFIDFFGNIYAFSFTFASVPFLILILLYMKRK
ncbi:DUF6328 family protein [Candidatus Nitrosocosmicus sp. T]